MTDIFVAAPAVRPAAPADAAGIRALLRASFPTPAEADLVEMLGRDGDVVISLVAEQEGEIVGHVLLSRMKAVGDGRDYRALGLGPVAVAPPWQRRGIGSGLIEGALGIAEATGEEIIFVLGEPEYYARFGFAQATAAPFASPYAGPFLMALTLGGAELPEAGSAEYARAFAELEAPR